MESMTRATEQMPLDLGTLDPKLEKQMRLPAAGQTVAKKLRRRRVQISSAGPGTQRLRQEAWRLRRATTHRSTDAGRVGDSGIDC